MRRFGYLTDGLFMAACGLYVTNKVLLHFLTPGHFWSGHFNDLLLIPCALPVILGLHRRFGWRTHDAPPTLAEVSFHVLIWSVICEGVGPQFLAHATADPFDVSAYAIGGLLAWAWWQSPGRESIPQRCES